jgi:hypothetical protein
MSGLAGVNRLLSICVGNNDVRHQTFAYNRSPLLQVAPYENRKMHINGLHFTVACCWFEHPCETIVQITKAPACFIFTWFRLSA